MATESAQRTIENSSYKESYKRKVRFCEPLMILYHPAGELHAQSFEMSAVELFRIEVNPARLRYPTHPERFTKS